MAVEPKATQEWKTTPHLHGVDPRVPVQIQAWLSLQQYTSAGFTVAPKIEHGEILTFTATFSHDVLALSPYHIKMLNRACSCASLLRYMFKDNGGLISTQSYESMRQVAQDVVSQETVNAFRMSLLRKIPETYSEPNIEPALLKAHLIAQLLAKHAAAWYEARVKEPTRGR